MKDVTPVSAFDYAVVSADDAAKLHRLASGIKKGHRRHFDAVLQVGRDLIEAKGILGHGNFIPWLEAEFRWDERTAQRYMGVASELGSLKTDKLSDLDLGSVYALAAKSTPPEVRQQVVQRIEAGEHVAPAEIRGIVKDARADARREREQERIANLKPAKRASLKRQQTKAQKAEEEWRSKRERTKSVTAEAAEFLRGHLGEALVEFVALFAEVDLHEFRRLLGGSERV